MSGYVGDESLARMILSYLDDDEVSLRPDDPASEVKTNTWSYGVPAGEFDAEGVVAALGQVRDHLRRRLAAHSGSGTFYCWYDEQAGQLRCSLTSRRPDQLPFRRPYYVTADVGEVIRLARADPHPGVVTRNQLVDIIGSSESVGEPLHAFPVWAVRVR